MGEAAIAKATTYDESTIQERWLEILETAVTCRRGLGGVRLGQRLVARLTSSAESTAHVEERRSAPPMLYTPAEVRTVTLELLAGVASSVSNSWFATYHPDKSTPTALVIPAECRTRDSSIDSQKPMYLRSCRSVIPRRTAGPNAEAL